MRCAVFLLNGVCDKKTDIRRQKTDIRRQKTDVREQITENRNQKIGNRKRKSESRKQISRLWAGIRLKVSDLWLPAVFLFP